MRNPNGYGSVVKLSGNRRNPFAVRKTVGWNEKKHPVYMQIAYCATREEGMMILAEYNRKPYDIDLARMTLEELYSKWSARDFPKMSKASVGALKAAYKKTGTLQNMRYKDIKAFQIQDIIDKSGSYATQGAVKNLFGHLDKFAMEMDIITRSNSTMVPAAPIPETSKRPFTEEEVKAVWNLQNKPWVDSVLFFLYTGFRISEMLGIKTADVDLDAGTITGGIKTKAGKNRIVPIHSKILTLVKHRVKENNEYLFSFDKTKCSDTQYYRIWGAIMDDLKMEHTPHECRHTFRSRLDSAGANKVCIDLMMGHKSSGTGERVYTHKTLEELKIAIEFLKD